MSLSLFFGIISFPVVLSILFVLQILRIILQSLLRLCGFIYDKIWHLEASWIGFEKEQPTSRDPVPFQRPSSKPPIPDSVAIFGDAIQEIFYE